MSTPAVAAAPSTPTVDISTQLDFSIPDNLTPPEVVRYLDQFIVGQSDAKKAVAIAFRNRWRRQHLPLDIRNEVIPKNILMIGPTGCGKTEIARKLAKLSNAPFLKTEATKYTEVGYHGQDAVNMIKDLVDVSFNNTKKRVREQVKETAALNVEVTLLKKLMGDSKEIESYRSMLREGVLNERIVEVEVSKSPLPEGGGAEFGNGQNFGFDILGMMRGVAKKTIEKKKMTISEARKILEEEEIEKLTDQFDIQKEAIRAVEESGIIVIDEIDKIVSNGDNRGSSDASAEGVQRDLLPIVEGTMVNTKRGNVNTEFILFICAGSFHSVKPSDLLPELQGRLPIRVTLNGLSEDELYRILTEPVNNLVRQQIELMKSEKVELVFDDGSIREIAKMAHEANRTIENIGARRLFSVMERVMEEISFEAAEKAGQRVEMTADYVRKRLSDILVSADLRKYII